MLGPSGCGKTTTTRMIAGPENASKGEILVGDRKVNDLDPKDRDVAMVFQSYGPYPNLDLYENIRFRLKMRKVEPAAHDERIMKAAELAGLIDFLHRKPAELSGGQRQRLAQFARAAPVRVLMVKPLSNLNAKLRVTTRAQIKDLNHELKVTIHQQLGAQHAGGN